MNTYKEKNSCAEIFYGIYLGIHPENISNDFSKWLSNGFGKQLKMDWNGNKYSVSEMLHAYLQTKYNKNEKQWPEELRESDVWLEEYKSRHQDRRIAVVHNAFTVYTDERGDPSPLDVPATSEMSNYNKDIKTFCRLVGIKYEKPMMFVISYESED